MSACCMGFASTGEHDKSCTMGKGASEAAPEYTSPVQSLMRQLTPADRAKMDARIEALKAADLIARQNYLKSQEPRS